MPNITRILCAVDFSECSDAAFDYADDLAASVGADLVVLHAFDSPASYDQVGQTIPADPAIAEKVEQIKSCHDEVEVKHVLHAGIPGEVICWAAQEHVCDLIVMGTHGRTGLRHLVFGSVAEYVLKHARCPVLTVRLQKADLKPLEEPVVTPLPPPPYM